MAISSSSVQNNQNRNPGAVMPRSQTYRSGSSAISLQEGQVLRGIVSDVHGNEITLALEDGSSFTGKMPDANQYSIGQLAAFEITYLDNNTIYMKTISGAYLLGMEDTIEQALEEASLPKTSRNLEVVRSLLQNSQSISRENIMASIRLCAKYPDADVKSVITMNALHLPMDEESLTQFQQYENKTHQLVNKMDTLMDSVNTMLDSISTQVPRFAKAAGEQLFSLALSTPVSPEESKLLLANAQTYSEEAASVPGEEPNSPIPPETSVSDEAENQSGSGISRVKQLFNNLSQSINQSLSGRPAAEASDSRSVFLPQQLGYALSEESRQALADMLKAFPSLENLKSSIQDGSLTSRELLQNLSALLPHLTDEQASQLLSGKPLQQVLKQHFIAGWTLTPEELKDEGSVSKMYETLSHQLHELSTLSENLLGKDVFHQVTRQASDMEQNMNFMKLLNNTFQYVQLPLQLQNQNAHGDLYVMTRKESLKKNPDELKVLLHLDLDHLGLLDIQIEKHNTVIQTNFFVEKDPIKHLLEKNVNLLSDALNEQGFAFTSEFHLKEKELDIVEDFMQGQGQAPVGNIRRYNFDLRA